MSIEKKSKICKNIQEKSGRLYEMIFFEIPISKLTNDKIKNEKINRHLEKLKNKEYELYLELKNSIEKLGEFY